MARARDPDGASPPGRAVRGSPRTRGGGPALSARGLEELAERRDREAAALGENLRRRKAQARARAERAGGTGPRGPRQG
jgi:hypothetical protein